MRDTARGDTVTRHDAAPGRPGWAPAGTAAQPGEVPGAVTRSGPAVARMMLGGQLRRHREAAGFSPDQAAWEIRGSRAKISRIETGRGKVKDRDLLDLLALYGVSDADALARMQVLARQARAAEWWHGYGDVLPAWFEPYLGMEDAASLIRSFDLLFVPGLFQTPAYARAVTALGSRDLRASEIDRRVELRLRRQDLLDGTDPPRVWALLDEAALRRPVGGADVMRGQVRRLAEVTGLASVSLQVLPFSAGAHDAAAAFTILRFREPGVADVAYVEQLSGGAYIDKRDGVDRCLDVMNRLSAAALSPAATAAFLDRMLDAS
jgi:Domain of unknown function (DUF5753)/Helix-turn-helix domain